MTNNVMLAGVGGQGLVLMTKIISQTAFLDGFDVKTNDVVGLSQRGGMVYGNVRFGEKIHSPNIPIGQGDILIALEPLEGLRWSYMVKKGGIIVLNTDQIYPTMVQQEKEKYPVEDIEALANNYKLVQVDAKGEAKKLRKTQVVNTIMLGVLSKYLSLSQESWIEAIKGSVKVNTTQLNIQAFQIGQTLSDR
jgi:indolepyruvate ferredoxin oxidoreductase, beta subunit